MAKKKDGTVENRVYLFKDLASAYIVNHPDPMGAEDGAARNRALRALADIAYASCVMADSEGEAPEAVARLIARGWTET